MEIGNRDGIKQKLYLTVIFIIVVFMVSSIFVKKKGAGDDNLKNSVLAGESSEKAAEEGLSPTLTNVSAESIEVSTQPKRKNSVKIGIVVDDYANKFSTITSIENKLGVNISTISIYKQFGHPENKYLNLEDLGYTRKANKTLLIAWEPWNPSEGNSQSKDYLSEIISGNFDEYIKKFANDVKSYGGPVIIRFAHEMNGNWYPWGRKPEEYKKAHQHVFDVFKSLGVANATFNWSVNFENVPYEPISELAKYYPGDSYINSIGIDGFNWGQGSGRSWKSFKDIFYTPYNYLNNNYQKPIIITETASSEIGGSKSDWIKEMFVDLNSSLNDITEIIWFNLLKEADWRLESSDASLTAFSESVE